MWFTDVGRYQASNYGLLKTVLEVNLQLFQKPPSANEKKQSTLKTTMIFLLRDFAPEETPLATIKDLLLRDIRGIWADIRKPEGLESSAVDDYFELRTVGIMKRQAKHIHEFEEDVKRLRNVIGETRPKNYSRGVPADGLAFYCESVWNTIINESSLDIPSQKEMLATFRCEEIKALVMAEKAPMIAMKANEAHSGKLSEFKTWAETLIKESITEYQEIACRYDDGIAGKKEEDLIDALISEMQRIVDLYLSHGRRHLLVQAQEALEASFCPGGNQREAWKVFNKTCDNWKSKFLQDFQTLAADCLVESAGKIKKTFNTNREKESFKENLNSFLERMQERQYADFKTLCDTLLDESLNERMGDIEGNITQSDFEKQAFWATMSETLKESIKEVVEALAPCWEGLMTIEPSDDSPCADGCPAAALSPSKSSPLAHNVPNFEKVVASSGCRQMIAKLVHAVRMLHHYIQSRFTVFFSADAEGVPHEWQDLKPEAIRKLFLVAKDKALEAIEVFREAKLDENGYLSECGAAPEQTIILINDRQEESIKTRATKTMQASCKEALTIRAAGSSATNIPMWMYVLLAALGYNEIAMVLTSPFFLLLTLTVGFILTVSYMTGNMELPLTVARHVLASGTTIAMSVIQKVNEASNEGKGAAKAAAAKDD
eukprot:Selendium_serpulae@DN3419_c0_g1_i1.p1